LGADRSAALQKAKAAISTQLEGRAQMLLSSTSEYSQPKVFRERTNQIPRQRTFGYLRNSYLSLLVSLSPQFGGSSNTHSL